MGNILRGILYTGLAATTGIAGYMLGKYKHMKGISLTMVGLALVLYAPKGCDVLETHIKTRGEVEKARIYGNVRKDSIDKIMDSEKLRDSTLYLKQFLKTALTTNNTLEEAYKGMIETNEREYQNLLKKNDAQYISTLNNLSKQNDILKKNIEDLKVIQASNYGASSTTKNTSTLNTSDIKEKPSKSLDSYIAEGDYGKIIGSETLRDGTRVDTRVFHDGVRMTFTYPSMTDMERKYVITNQNSVNKKKSTTKN